VEPILRDGRFTDRSTLYKRPKPGSCQELLPWYQIKNCYFEQEIPLGDALFSRELPEQLADAFRTLEPLYHYFRKLETTVE
jgi:hypothetical protein